MNRVLVAMLLCGVTNAVLATETAEPIPIDYIRLFSEVYEQIKTNSPAPIANRILFEKAIGGMLSANDENSELLRAEDYNRLIAYTTGELALPGFSLKQVSDTNGRYHWQIANLVPRSSAAMSGLKIGQTILAINAKPSNTLSNYAIESLLSGDLGSTLTVDVARSQDKDIQTLTMTRDQPDQSSVVVIPLSHNRLYIRIKAFQDNTPSEFQTKLKRTNWADVQTCIIDLRDNRGGVVEAAFSLANYFLAKDSVISRTISRQGTRDIVAKDIPAAVHVNLLMLANRHTASAAEVFIGAIKDNNRGRMIGENTYGKASIQRLIPINKDYGLRLTTAHYLTPNNIDISEHGIAPDITVDVDRIGIDNIPIIPANKPPKHP